MDLNKRKFFGSFAAMAAAPVAGLASAMGVREELPKVESVTTGTVVSAEWWNRQADLINSALEASRR